MTNRSVPTEDMTAWTADEIKRIREALFSDRETVNNFECEAGIVDCETPVIAFEPAAFSSAADFMRAMRDSAAYRAAEFERYRVFAAFIDPRRA